MTPQSESADPHVPRNTLAVGDCLQSMASWPADSVDLVFADPPYNIGYTYDQYDDNRSDEDYIQWTCDWIDACTRLLKPTGSLYILIGDEYAAETRLHLKQLEKTGQLLFRNWIIWHYTFGQRCKVKFNRSHAHLFYCVGSAALTPQRKRKNKKNAKTKANSNADAKRSETSDPPDDQVRYQPKSDLVKNPPFTFHYDEVALPSARMTTYSDKRQNPKGKLPDDTWYLRQFPGTADWYTRPPEAQADGMFRPDEDTWCQSRLCGTFNERTGHPCQLPEALLERIVRVSSNPGDLVFDPFAGSGTTLAVAKRLGRDYLGCEMSDQYAEQVRQRLDAQPVDVERSTDSSDAPARGADADAPSDSTDAAPSNESDQQRDASLFA